MTHSYYFFKMGFIERLPYNGKSESMSEEKAASLGIKGFLLKPIVMKNLSQKIREVLDENKV
jgi:hypothetical protein